MKKLVMDNDDSLKELIDREIKMVKNNRWLNEREKFVKIQDLNRTLNSNQK